MKTQEKLNYLAINTAGGIEILLRIGGEYYFSCHDDVATQVLPHINELLLKAGAKIEDIDVLGVCVGPGSFTGIRVGLSTIKAMGYALNKPIVSVTYFDVLAYDYDGGMDELTVIIDGKNQVSYLKNSDDEGLCIKNEDIKKHALKNVVYDSEYKGRGLGRVMDKKIAEGEFLSYEKVLPLYLRKSQPERQDGEI